MSKDPRWGTDEEFRFFGNSSTTLDDIKNAGWYIEHSSGGGWWWRHKETGKLFMPHWVVQLSNNSAKSAVRDLQNQICSLLIPEKQKKSAPV